MFCEEIFGGKYDRGWTCVFGFVCVKWMGVGVCDGDEGFN